jgi:hypothetical protein
MGSALVVGDRGCGLTTFVGLLYAAQLRLGTEEQDEFRFSAERETIRELESIYGELVAGRFPEWDVNWEAHPLSFVFGFRAGKFGRFGRGGINGDSRFDTVHVQVGGIPAEEVAEFAEHDAVLEESTRRLLRSSVVLPLVDASRLLPRPDGPKNPVLARYDRMLATTLEVVYRFHSAERSRKVRKLNPLFVVTKFDKCPPATLAEVGVPKGPPATWPSGAREEVGRKILGEYFPVTTLFFEKTKREQAAAVASPLWFYSSLQVAPDSNGLRILRRSRVPIGGWEPEYPFEEYRTLIEQLGRLAHRFPSREERP